MKKTVRLIVTEDCPRKCSYCCNKISDDFKCAKKIKATEFFATGYDEIVITGGEPMLVPDRVASIVWQCGKPAYLYTALYNDACRELLRSGMFIGISYTLHEKFSKNDWEMFLRLQKDVREMSQISARLKIHPSVNPLIWKGTWSRVDRRPFILFRKKTPAFRQEMNCAYEK